MGNGSSSTSPKTGGSVVAPVAYPPPSFHSAYPPPSFHSAYPDPSFHSAYPASVNPSVRAMPVHGVDRRVSRASSMATSMMGDSMAFSDCNVYSTYDPSTQRRSTVTVPNANPVYKNGGPSVQADEVYGCFTTTMTVGEKKKKKKKSKDSSSNGGSDELQVASPPGHLFRLVNHLSRRWYFYNDTKEFVMVVTGYFGPRSLITCLPPAKMWREMPSGLILMELVIEPLQTMPFLEGDAKDGFDLRFKAVPLKEAGDLVNAH